ncbi:MULTISPECIES: helix-turn-helix transcriptional regulator [unclassified Microbacterium]|uniref:helix-turn-helix transcriptional regulator n=1 Tax=unclassified Microbacterium TaxID=2609290 RepID=UPI0012F9D52F|nr:helix-turn-helix transcriptional regulator [Microbacterium sp. MAH-37]MVQ43434.1 helix-turn-helix domain-containing protein [Microbacterium sp. MAH-37]
MDADQRRREELAAFLRDRRARVDRAALGLPVAARSRVSGLRREEVATLAGVSVTWYTWLEQARDINPSRQVLDSLGRLFGLRPVELTYLRTLGGHGELTPAAESTERAPERLRRLLESFPFPAFLLAEDWSIIGWNPAYAQLYPRIETLDADDRNLLWLLFTDESLRRMLPDWAEQSRRFVGEFRAEARRWLAASREDGIVTRVSAASTDFARIWQERDVAGFVSRERTFRHPLLGTTVYEQHGVVPSEFPDLELILYVPASS